MNPIYLSIPGVISELYLFYILHVNTFQANLLALKGYVFFHILLDKIDKIMLQSNGM